MTRKLLALGLLLSAFSAEAQLFKRDAGDELIQPDEEKLEFPAAPKDENLLPFDPGYATNLRFFIDRASIKVGKTDRIVRYTVIIKSSSGASSSTYEALRCDTGERKVFAYGAPDGSWSAARDSQWKAFDKKDVYRYTLYNDFFCPRTAIVGSVREAVDALIRGGHDNARFKASDQY